MCFVHSKRSAGCLLCKFHTLSSIFPGLMSFIGKSDIWPCSVKAVLGSLSWTRKWIYDYRYKQFCILKFFHRSKNTCSKSTEKKKQDDTNVLTIAIPSPFNKVLDIVLAWSNTVGFSTAKLESLVWVVWNKPFLSAHPNPIFNLFRQVKITNPTLCRSNSICLKSFHSKLLDQNKRVKKTDWPVVLYKST